MRDQCTPRRWVRSALKAHSWFLSGLIQAVSTGKGWHCGETWGVCSAFDRSLGTTAQGHQEFQPQPNKEKVVPQVFSSPKSCCVFPFSTRDPTCTKPSCTFLERRGQPQLPQLRLHGVGELLQGPRVQAHPVRCLVPCTGKVQLPELGEPPGTQRGNRSFSWGRAPLG